MEKLFAKWKACPEGIATRREAIHDKIDDKSRVNWTQLDADLKRRKADILTAYEEKRMADRKADQERRKAERKAYDEKMMANRKAGQERREAYEKMMAERKADQERGEAERKAYEEKMMAERKADQEKREAERKAHEQNLQKMRKEMMDANQTKTDNNQEGMDVDLKETREEIKSGEAEMKFTVNALQEKMDASTATGRMIEKKRRPAIMKWRPG
jgi:hypothetical protein